MHCSNNRVCVFGFFFTLRAHCASHHIVQLSDKVCTCECAYTIMSRCTHAAIVTKVLGVVFLE